jgi:LmeA-like phospholipid-binding
VRVRRAGRIAAWLAGAIVLALVLAQLFLPGIAASRVRARVGKYGTVRSVTVKAWPAVELLWGKAESVEVKAGSLSMSPTQTVKLLGEARGVRSMSLTAESVKEGPLQLHEASFQKRGDALQGQASTSRADVNKALGEGIEVQLLSSHDGQVEVRASGGLFGVRASVDAVARAQEGKLVVHPLGFLLEGLKLTLIDNPHVRVEGVGASAVAGASGKSGEVAGYRLSIWASLR